MDMGERIRKARKKASLTQKELACECNVTTAAVGQWETGASKTMKPENLFSVARATGFAPQWLGTGQGPEMTGGMQVAYDGCESSCLPVALRRLMDERGLSEGRLAELSGVPQPTIHRMLTGQSKDPRRSNVTKIAQVFGLTAAQLLLETSEGFSEAGQGVNSAGILLVDPEEVVKLLAGELSEVELGNAESKGLGLAGSAGLHLAPENGGAVYMLLYKGPQLRQFGIYRTPAAIILNPESAGDGQVTAWLVDGYVRIGVYEVYDGSTCALNFMDDIQGKIRLDLEESLFLGVQIGVLHCI